MRAYLFVLAFLFQVHLVFPSSCCSLNTIIKYDRCVCSPNSTRRLNGKCEPCPADHRFFTPSTEILTFECRSCPLTKEASMCVKCQLGEVIIDDSGDCGLCPPGSTFKPPPTSYDDTRQADCAPCEPGFFKQNFGQHPCTPCPSGMSSGIGATHCKSCLHNQKVMFTGKCGKCPPGHFLSRKLLRCRPCPYDTYQPNSNAEWECIKCPNGEQARRGAERCTKCPDRQFLMGNMGECGSCKPGSVYDYTYRHCHYCSEGMFSNGTTSPTKCLPCPEGSKSSRGARNCKKCPKGQALFHDNNCGKCPPGTYFSRGYCFDVTCKACMYYNQNIGKCQICPNGTISTYDSTLCVSCPVGTILLWDGSCGNCEPGFGIKAPTASPYCGFLECERCDRNEYSNSSTASICKKCPEGHFSDYGSTKCTKCPKGTFFITSDVPGNKVNCGKYGDGHEYSKRFQYCRECPLHNYSNKTSHFRCKRCPCDQYALEGSSKCIECPNEQVLLKPGKCGVCGPGYQYHPMDLTCEKCERNKFSNRSTGNICVGCPSGSTSHPGASQCEPK